MKREIKFRGKRLDNGEWVYGFLADEDYINDINSIDLSSIEVDPATVSQYTGLKDCNGKEIYEGDIVKDKLGSIDVLTYDSLAFNLCVAYSSSPNGTCANFFGKNNPLDGLEVVSNIHDNPELLEGKK